MEPVRALKPVWTSFSTILLQSGQYSSVYSHFDQQVSEILHKLKTDDQKQNQKQRACCNRGDIMLSFITDNQTSEHIVLNQ